MNDWLKRTPAGVTSRDLLRLVQTEFNRTKVPWNHVYDAGVDLLCASHFNLFDEWLSMPTDPNPEASAHTLDMLQLLEDILDGPARPYAQLARTSDQLAALLAHRPGDPEYRVAIVHALEGAHALGGDLGQIARLAKRGVALITVTHFFQKGITSAPNAFPFFPDSGSRWAPQGLSSFGADVIAEMECNKVIVDVTHMTDAAVNDVLHVARRPLVATHASSRTLGDHPYSLYDEQIQEIARKGGIIGVILYPYVLSNYADEDMAQQHGSLRDVVRTILHIEKICGTHTCVGIGSDFSGFIQGPKEFSCLGQIGLLRRELERDLDPGVVEDIMANNVIRFMTTQWGKGV